MSPKMGYGRGDDMCGAERDGDGAPCTLAYGHEPPHSYAGAAFTRAAETCAICGSREGVRRFAVTVDGVELRAVADLCGEHGDAHLLNVGRVLGELFAKRIKP